MLGKDLAKKRILLVNREFQFRYVKVAILTGLITTLCTAFIILYPLYIFGILRVTRFLPWPILIAMTITAIINISALAFMLVFITHRVAGPMHSLFREIRQVGRGNFCIDLRFRPNDEFGFVIRNFNEMALNLQDMTKKDIATIDRILEHLTSNSHAELKQDLIDLRTTLTTRLDERRRGMSSATII